MSIAGGFAQAAHKTASEYHCNAMQIFTKSPRSRMVKPIDPEDAQRFRETCQKHGINYIIAHSSYLLNFGKSLAEVPWAEKDLLTDFERLSTLGGTGVIIHVGKSLDGERDIAIQNVIENAKQIVDKTEHTGLQYIIENTAGQGTEIGYRLEEMAKVWKGLDGFNKRVKTCLDTAHIWGAGYDISTPKGAADLLTEYDKLIGIRNLSCIHFNDSKKECGSKVDRHDNLGEGLIGKEGLLAIAKYAESNSIPIILETPEKDGKTHLGDINLLRSWMG